MVIISEYNEVALNYKNYYSFIYMNIKILNIPYTKCSHYTVFPSVVNSMAADKSLCSLDWLKMVYNS